MCNWQYYLLPGGGTTSFKSHVTIRAIERTLTCWECIAASMHAASSVGVDGLVPVSIGESGLRPKR